MAADEVAQMTADDPVVIVGAGLIGAGAAWALSRRDVPVVVVEQFGVGHRFGGSHGSARIVRRAYGDALYVGLTGRAFELWAQIEHATGATLLRRHGGLDFGPERDVPTMARLLADAGVEHEVLPAAEAQARWPGMRFDGDVVFHPQAGTLDADSAVSAMLDLARAAGADVREHTAVASVRGARVELTDGSALAARSVVVAAGGWVAPLLADVDALELPPIRVARQSVFHFPRRDVEQARWPSTIHEFDGTAVYHLAGGRDGGPGEDRKVGVHDPGPLVAPTDEPGVIDDAVRAFLLDYVARWLPGLDPTPRGETTCLYTLTPSEDFLLDRVIDRAGELIVCSTCSGHGAKFAPLIGEYVADMVTGASDAGPVPDRFRLASHLAGATGSVSL